MNPRYATAVMASLALTTAAASLLLYDKLPALLPVHWNWQGYPNGWADRAHAAFLLPIFIAASLLLMHALRRISALAIRSFEPTFCYVFVILAGLFGYIHAIMLLTGLNPAQDYSRHMIVGICLFLALLGNVLGKVRRSRWMGIRTPWTLASDAVWIPTHRLAARLLVVAGVISAAAVGLGAKPAIYLWLLGAAFLIPSIYSYVLHQRLGDE